MRPWIWYPLAALAGCSGPDVADQAVCGEVRKDVPTAPGVSLDLLIVLDTSPSFADQRAALPTHVERWGNILANIEGGVPSVRIGMVSSDVASRGGALESEPQLEDCEAIDDPYLQVTLYANGDRDYNFTGDLDRAMQCLAMLPSDGTRLEEPFEAMRTVLQGDFHRQGAALLVVFVSDEDDCSGGASLATGDGEARTSWQCLADSVVCDEDLTTVGDKSGCTLKPSPDTLTPIDEYEDFLRGFSDGAYVFLSAVHAPNARIAVQSGAEGSELSSVCGAGQATAYPTPRIAGLLQRFPLRTDEVDVCSDDWDDVLATVATPLDVIGSPCLEGQIDLDPAQGLQASCAVTEFLHESGDERVLGRCSSDQPDEDERPCWRAPADPNCEGGYAFVVEPAREVAQYSTVSVRCSTGCQ